MTDPFTTARNDIAGLPGHGMSADVQVAEQRVGEVVAMAAVEEAARLLDRNEVVNDALADLNRAMIDEVIPQIVRDREVQAELAHEMRYGRRPSMMHRPDAKAEVNAAMVAHIDMVLATNAPDAAKREGQ